MTDLIDDLEIAPGATESVAVQPATVVSGETEGSVKIYSNNGRELFQSDQTRDDAFSLISTAPTLKFKNVGNTTAKVKVYGVTE